MSCFIVNDYHVNALVTWAALQRVPLDYSAPVAAELLAAANRRAFAQRYEGRYQDESPAFGGYQAVDVSELLPVGIVKACDCLAYQSSDWTGWDASEAAELLRAIRSAACCMVKGPQFHRLPGYEAAAWELFAAAEVSA